MTQFSKKRGKVCFEHTKNRTSQQQAWTLLSRKSPVVKLRHKIVSVAPR